MSAWLLIPLSLTSSTLGGICALQRECVVQRRDKSPQIPVIHAHQFGPRVQHPLQIVCVVELDQDVHAELLCVVVKIVKIVIVEAFGNEQNAVGTCNPRFGNLVAVDDEFLPHHGNCHTRGPSAEHSGCPENSVHP
jgi:hypothetical protein